MNNLNKALELAKKEISEGIRLTLSSFKDMEKPESYREFIELVYDGNARLFKDDLSYTFHQQYELDFVTDDLDIITEEGNIVTYRKFINILKKEYFKGD